MHGAKVVKTWLDANVANYCCPWPASSPDLNPIENLWSFFQDAVADYGNIAMAEFEDVLSRVWWNIPQDYIRNLYHSMPHRLAAVIDREGKMTKY